MDFPPRVRGMVQRECSVWHNSWMGPPRHAPLKRMLQGHTGQNFKEDIPRIQCWKSWKKNKNRLQASVSKAAEVWTLILSLLKKKQNITLSTNIHIQITRKHVISIWSSKIRFSVVGKENTNRDTKSKSRHFQFLLPVVNSTHVWEEGIDPYFVIIPCILICRLKFSFPPQQTMGLPKPSCLRKEISWGSGSCVKLRVNGSFKPFAPRFLRSYTHAINP